MERETTDTNVALNIFKQARYECYRCKHRYVGPAGPTQCPRCGNLYIKWLNYKEWEMNDL